jgi:iron complex transport system permease protein
MKRIPILMALLIVAVAVLFVVDLTVGSVAISIGDVVAALTGGDCPATTATIVCDIRLVKALVALLAGIALSVSGLQMQTLFRNPLAGPYVLGVSSGASLMVALFILGAPALGLASSTFMSGLGTAGAAWIGSALVLGIIAAASRRIKDIMVILVLGIMVGSAVSAIVQILQYMSSDEALKAYVVWTMGSLGNVTSSQLPLIATAVAIGLLLAVATVKPLNMLLLGEEYASTMGLNLHRTRSLIYLSTILLAGTVTAFCGPIGFIGLAMPHVARLLSATADHRALLPTTALAGAAAMLLCDIIAKIFVLPINAIMSLIGIPIVIWIVLRKSISL